MNVGRIITELFEFLPAASSSEADFLRPKWLVLGGSGLGERYLADARDWGCSLG